MATIRCLRNRLILPLAGLTGVFLLLSGVTIVGDFCSLLGPIEARGKVLEHISR
jgi:hypothetical protein